MRTQAGPPPAGRSGKCRVRFGGGERRFQTIGDGRKQFQKDNCFERGAVEGIGGPTGLRNLAHRGGARPRTLGQAAADYMLDRDGARTPELNYPLDPLGKAYSWPAEDVVKITEFEMRMAVHQSRQNRHGAQVANFAACRQFADGNNAVPLDHHCRIGQRRSGHGEHVAGLDR